MGFPAVVWPAGGPVMGGAAGWTDCYVTLKREKRERGGGRA